MVTLINFPKMSWFVFVPDNENFHFFCSFYKVHSIFPKFLPHTLQAGHVSVQRNIDIPFDPGLVQECQLFFVGQIARRKRCEFKHVVISDRKACADSTLTKEAVASTRS